MANLSQPTDDGIFLEVIAFSRSNLYGEYPQNSLDVCRMNGYLDQGYHAVVCRQGEETCLGFPHDFGIFANPDNQNELFSL